MLDYFEKAYHELEEKLRLIDLEEDNILKKSELCFQAALAAIHQLRND